VSCTPLSNPVTDETVSAPGSDMAATARSKGQQLTASCLLEFLNTRVKADSLRACAVREAEDARSHAAQTARAGPGDTARSAKKPCKAKGPDPSKQCAAAVLKAAKKHKQDAVRLAPGRDSGQPTHVHLARHSRWLKCCLNSM
jgi:hypothetical protein